MAAWTDPDPSLAPAANLGGGVPLRVDETRGAWARVTGSNGWTGWVDARLLQPVGAAPPPAAAPARPAPVARAAGTGAFRVTPALAGGVMMLVSAFLAWGDWSFSTGMDVPATRIYPLSEISSLWTWTQPRIGMILIAAGIVAALAAIVPAIPAGLRSLAGLLGIAMGVGIILLIGMNATWGDVVDHRLTGVYVAIVGGVLALLPSRSPA
ncbi:MAG: hypothetical protein KQH83_03570 [Actinobacteria bacterium]|nr:hypothetical protein [Actinomycetota bacterium]